jgi:choice-of-anchor B domain-containing protein
MSFRTLATMATLGILAAAPARAAMVPCVNGMAGQYPCRGVDLMAFMPHSTYSGGSGNDIWGWTDGLTGREYAIVGAQKGTAFIDITAPESPVYVGFLPCWQCTWPADGATRHEDGPPDDKDTPRCEPGDDHLRSHGGCQGDSQWRDMEVYADHVYIGSEQGGHGLVVFDLRQLRNVTSPPVRFTETFRFAGVGQSHTVTVNPESGKVFINGSRTATACAPGPTNSGGPVILDAAANPSAPTFAGCVVMDGYTHDSQCVTYQGPHTAFLGHEICLNSNEDTLTVVDATNPQAPVLLSRASYPGVGYTHQGWLTSDSRYFLLDDELDESNFQHPTKTYIFDLLSLTSPSLVGTHFGTTAAIDHNQYIVGRYAYQSNYRAGLRIQHTGRAGQGKLREVGFFDVFPANDNRGFNGTWANYPFFPSGNVVVNTIESNGGLFVVRPRRTNLELEVAPLMPGAFRLTVRNEGPADVDGAEVMVSGGTLLALIPSQGSCTRRPAACSVGALAAGASATVDVVLSPFSMGKSVQATVEATGALDLAASDDEVTFASSAAWK